MDISTEYPIGTRITLEVVEGACDDCFFSSLDYDNLIDCCKRVKCASCQRKDKKNIIFKLSKKA